MKARGFKLKQIWVDADGFPGSAGNPLGPVKRYLDPAQFVEALQRLTANTDEAFSSRLCGELYAYARGLKALWEVTHSNMDENGLNGGKRDAPEQGRLPF
jgi:hypothetical protein